ncbi:MAG: DedA family protein [Armatimonadota bacterium]
MEQILKVLIQITEAIITKLGYPGVMIASALESACIPLPSEIIFPFSGYLAYKGVFTFWNVIIWGMIGQILGSLLAYAVGYYGAIPFLKRYGKYVFIKEHEIENAHKWFEKYGDMAIFWSRLLPVIRTFISLPAGIAKMNIWKFLIYTTIGCLPWLIALTYAGVYLGANWLKVKDFLFSFKEIIIVVLIIGIVYWFYIHLKKKKNSKNVENNLKNQNNKD